MTDLLEQAIAALRGLPPHERDAFARALLETLHHQGFHRLTAEDRAAIEMSRAQARRGEFVSSAEMDSFWAYWSRTED